MTPPSECNNLQEIRCCIDSIDKNIIELLGLRLKYVKAASNFKPDVASIPAPQRVGEMIPQRQLWAEQNDLNPEFIGPFFAQIIYWFIDQQIQHWKKMNNR